MEEEKKNDQSNDGSMEMQSEKPKENEPKKIMGIEIERQLGINEPSFTKPLELLRSLELWD